MNSLLLPAGLTLGCGQPHIVVSMTGKSECDLLEQSQRLAACPQIAMAEWRADHFEHALNLPRVLSVLPKIEQMLQGKPLIFTFRTSQEGGACTISPQAYIDLCEAVAASQLADLIDVQMFWQDAAQQSVQKIHALGGKIIGSWHDFQQTPTSDDLIARFEAMQQSGADVLKIAVMPQCEQDAATLMSAAHAFSRRAARPLCAISMGELGRITRTHGEAFGSCLTFGALESSSAPGQIAVPELYKALTAIHNERNAKR